MKMLLQLALLLVALFASNLYAANIEFKWQNSDTYTDIQAVGANKTQFKQSLFKQLEKHMGKLSRSMDDSFLIQLTVTNVDLAGDVQWNFDLQQQIRLVTDLYPPKLVFQYRVLQQNQKIISGTFASRDMAFMLRGSAYRSSHDSFYYEKEMLSRWYQSELKPAIDDHFREQNAVMSQ